MPQHEVLAAAHERDLGMRKIGRFTWRAGLAGVACSAVLAVALGHHAAARASNPQQTGTSKQHRTDQGTIVIPAQPPRPAGGPGHVVSGAS